MVKLVYFAWVRERIGTGEETVDLPAGIETGAQLLDWLARRGDGHADALSEPNAVRIAVDKQLISPHDPISGGSEIAIFPPMTGG